MGLGDSRVGFLFRKPDRARVILSFACFFSEGSAHIRLYLSISVHICLYLNMSWPGHTHFVTQLLGPQAAPQWLPGTKVDSVVPPPRWVVERDARHETKFSREEAEVFVTYTESHKRPGESLGDRMLDWASCSQYNAQNVHSRKIRHLVKRAVDEFIPEDVERADFSEKLDGAQTMVFYFRCLYDAIKELLRNARFNGRQYTQAEVVLNAAGDPGPRVQRLQHGQRV